MKTPKPKFKLVNEYDVTTYTCGLRAGDRVELIKPLAILDNHGKPTGQIHPAGEIWTVLPGASKDPGIVWFGLPNGERHTWTDNAKWINEWFKRLL